MDNSSSFFRPFLAFVVIRVPLPFSFFLFVVSFCRLFLVSPSPISLDFPAFLGGKFFYCILLFRIRAIYTPPALLVSLEYVCMRIPVFPLSPCVLFIAFLPLICFFFLASFACFDFDFRHLDEMAQWRGGEEVATPRTRGRQER